jgi:CubicO group peptidase (beta-lactamase class C family)
MALTTQFDMASCTKVVATTSVVALLYQWGYLPLDTPVANVLGPAFAANGKGAVTVLNCLLHNAGFPPDPVPEFWSPQFGCPQTSAPQPGEDFSCRDRIFSALLNQTLSYPVGSQYVYSDLSMITLMFVTGTIVQQNSAAFGLGSSSLRPGCATGAASDSQCWYEAFARVYVFQSLGLTQTMFLPPPPLWGNCAPAENDTSYERKLIQGQVSDGNAYALGGIAGHAGLFSTAADVAKFMSAYMFGGFLNATTLALFTAEYNHSQSSRALGWNTNDPGAPDMGWNLSCGSMSNRTYMHTGYTGTEICADPDRQIFTVLLTNRVYPNDSNIAIRALRQVFNTAVVNVLANHTSPDMYAFRVRQSAASGHARSPPKRRLIRQHDPRWDTARITADDAQSTLLLRGSLWSSLAMALADRGARVAGAAPTPDALVRRAAERGALAADGTLRLESVALLTDAGGDALHFVEAREAARTSAAAERDALAREGAVLVAQVWGGLHHVLVDAVEPAEGRVLVRDPAFVGDAYAATDVSRWLHFRVVRAPQSRA